MPVFHDIDTYQPPTVLDHLHLRILAMDDVDLNDRWRANGVRSPFWRLYLNDRRGAEVISSNASFPLLKGQVLLIPAWVQFDCANSMRLRHFYIHFDLVGFSPLAIRKVWNRPVQIAKSDDLAESARQIGDSIRADQRNLTQVMSEAKALVYRSLARAIPEKKTIAPQWASLLQAPAPIEPAIRYIENHIPGAMDNVTLAKACSRSRAHFIRMFHQAVGMTPKQYVIERRIAWAAERLVLSADSIETISAAAGFKNRFYFTRAFTRVIGTPPAKYRKSRL